MPNATILVVDDEPLIRWSLVERLRTDGYDVVEAPTGKEALQRVAAGVDLALLDYKLPDIDGVTVLRTLKAHDPDVIATLLRTTKERDPAVIVFLLTPSATGYRAVESMKIGAYHFANKPFNLDDISAM